MLKELNISIKRASINKLDINAQTCKEERFLKAQAFFKLLKSGSDVICLDKSPFNTNLH
jgi:hypothetical protein